MLGPVSVGLKFGFLAVLYLFLVWVALSSLFDLRRGRARSGSRTPDATGMYAATEAPASSREDFEPRLVVEHAAGHSPGIAYDLTDGRYPRAR